MANFGARPGLAQSPANSDSLHAGKPLARWLTCVPVLIVITACTGGLASRSTPSVQETKSVRFTADETMHMVAILARCDSSVTEGISHSWTPTEHQQLSLDRHVRAELPKIGSDPVLQPNGYYLQFFGVYRGGERMVFVNAFHEMLLPDRPSGTQPLGDWTREAIVICDGGSGTFQAYYDPQRQKFVWLRFGDSYGQSVGGRKTVSP
jgi:hypothetical protein